VVEPSPFPYFGPLAAGEVEGRGPLRADLKARIETHRLTALLGPRRYGLACRCGRSRESGHACTYGVLR
jgi:hypothetical protein